jgi:hypothetical protein
MAQFTWPESDSLLINQIVIPTWLTLVDVDRGSAGVKEYSTLPGAIHISDLGERWTKASTQH